MLAIILGSFASIHANAYREADWTIFSLFWTALNAVMPLVTPRSF
jgi:hypothetical protein